MITPGSDCRKFLSYPVTGQLNIIIMFNNQMIIDRIKMYGLGGQGVVTAARILVHATAIHEDKYAKTIPAYGHERRGAPVFSDLMISEAYIPLNSFVYEPDIVFLFDPAVVNTGITIDRGIHEDSILVVNTGDRNILDRLAGRYNFKKIYWVDATKIALETVGRDIPNGAMLGAAAGTGLVKIDSVKKSIRQFLHDKIGEKNARAAQRAFERTETIG